jgi:hypothetical protein
MYLAILKITDNRKHVGVIILEEINQLIYTTIMILKVFELIIMMIIIINISRDNFGPCPFFSSIILYTIGMTP